MSLWPLNPLLCIDTETTGVDPFTDRIVEVATVCVMPDSEAVNEWSAIVDPGIEIPDGAAQIHKITTSRAVSEGVEPAVALQQVADRIYEHVDTWGPAASPLVMFNARFDWPLLITEAHRHGIDLPAFAAILDPYLIDRLVDRQQARRAAARMESYKWRKGRRQLATLCVHYGVPLGLEDAHSALPDAVAAGRVMRKILEVYPTITDRSLATLWLRQVVGHEEDRARLVDWKRRNADPDFDSPPGWPIPTGTS